MASWLSYLNPTPAFPHYTGPYLVGTVDVELPTSELPSPCLAPDPGVATIHFRIFYPCDRPSKQEKPVWWVSEPQTAQLSAYARFLGARSALAASLPYLTPLLRYIKIPVSRNAPLLSPGPRRWPVVVLSHGLGGTRNAYSQLCGSLASYGMVVVAPDHRDGSAAISFIREVSGPVDSLSEEALDSPLKQKRTIDYVHLPHHQTPEVEEGRNKQLRVRLWELALIYEALLGLDTGKEMKNIDNYTGSSPAASTSHILSMFRNRLDIHEPGAICWAGHSFGAASVIQFVKSVYCRPSAIDRQDPYFSTYSPLFTPSGSSGITMQITPLSPVVALDLWTLPLRSSATRWLWNKPMPSYAPNGPSGANILAILSEAFFKWTLNLKYTMQVLSSNPALDRDSRDLAVPGPRIFYPMSSAHLSQSDFGILFPWLTKKALKVDDPERTMRLNVRAFLQLLRENGWQISGTSRLDREDPTVDEVPTEKSQSDHDWKIFGPSGSVKGWIAVDSSNKVLGEDANDEADAEKMPSDAVIDGELMDRERGTAQSS